MGSASRHDVEGPAALALSSSQIAEVDCGSRFESAMLEGGFDLLDTRMVDIGRRDDEVFGAYHPLAPACPMARSGTACLKGG